MILNQNVDRISADDRETMFAQRPFVSSGDLLADRRYLFGTHLAGRGDSAAAADLYEQALALAPGFASAWVALGEVREQLGDHPGALAALRRGLALDPDDRHGATLRIARLEGNGARGASSPMPTAYVRTLFDQYAPRFDAALVDGLGYHGPGILLDAIASVCRTAGRPMRFAAGLDLGCGTGLAGAVLRPCVGRLTGIDLSPGMIAQARVKNLYDELHAHDLMAFLAAAAGSAFDLITAADVFAYFPDLAPVAHALTPALRPGGLFAFTIETHPGPDAILQPTLRYAHGRAHVRAALEGAGFEACHIADISARTEKGAPVPGLVVVARRA
jgi:predicted TPR repeat methyltransferase